MKNIWEHGLVPFESEAEIIAAKKEYQEQNNIDLRHVIFLDKTIEQDVILAIYSDTKAWIPFADCGCEPRELYTILRCNALVCALATFSYLDTRSDRAISDLISQKKELDAGVIESILDEATERHRRNVKQDYLENCLLQIAYKEKETVQAGKKTKSELKIKTKPIFAPIIEVILSKKLEELDQRGEEKVDKLFPALVKVYDTYCAEGRSVRAGYSKRADSASIPEPISSEAKRQRRHRLCAAYERFYNEWMGMAILSQEHEREEDAHVSEFLQELVFHHRALSRSEQALKIASKHYEGELDIDGEVDNIAETLYCMCRIPLVFGADELRFRKRETEYAFGQYLDFIKLTIIRVYEQSNHDIGTACNTIRGLLKDSKFEELFKKLEKATDHCTIELPEKYLVERATAAVKGILKPDYYGKSGVTYAMSPDEYFSTVTETSRVNENSVHLFRENGKLKIQVDPREFGTDIRVGIACFKSKEKRDAFLTAPDEIKRIVAATFGATPEHFALVVPKDDEIPLELSNFKEILL